MRKIRALAVTGCLLLVFGAAAANPGGVYPRGLNPQAEQELRDAEVDKYVGMFSPVASVDVGAGWTKHIFDTADGAGPICIAGTNFSAFTKRGNPAKLLIMLQGGGACWQDFYNCNVLVEAENQQPPPPEPLGIWDDVSGLNPLEDWSVVYIALLRRLGVLRRQRRSRSQLAGVYRRRAGIASRRRTACAFPPRPA